MKIRHLTSALTEKIELNMTPMIDIVFQLLAFFIMTLKFVIPEGDFDIKMPAAAPTESLPPEELIPPIQVKLTANDDGTLKGIYVNDQFEGGFAELRNRIILLVAPQEKGPGAAAEGAEVELECDYDLLYENLIGAVTHVSGYVDDQGVIVKLIEKIRFKPPKAGRR